MASNSATASFALLDCSGPIRCNARPGQADINPGHFALASCTRFSPNTRWPASITGVIAPASKVLDTAISVTDAGSRRACLQARAISCSTAASPFGKCEVIGKKCSGAMSSVGHEFTGSSNFIEFGKGFLNPSTYLACGVGGKDVTRQFQPQKSETQAASRNPCAVRIAGGDPGGSSDAGPGPLARGYPQPADRACLSGICRFGAAQRRYPARSHLLGRDDVEIGGLYPRLGRRRAQLRDIARQPGA